MPQELAEKQATELAVINFEADAGAGFEAADKDSYAVPFLRILQMLSPQVIKGDDAYIEGASAGMLLDTVNGTLFAGDEGVLVVPCHYTHSYLEWVPRDAGGGFVAEHSPGAPIIAQGVRAEKGASLVLPTGNELMDTRNHFILAKGPDGVWREALIAMTSSNIGVSKRWMSFMQGRRAINASGQTFTKPSYSGIYRLTTVLRKNDKGSWYMWAMEFAQDMDSLKVYEQAKLFARTIKAGKVKVDHAVPESNPASYAPGTDSDDFGF